MRFVRDVHNVINAQLAWNKWLCPSVNRVVSIAQKLSFRKYSDAQEWQSVRWVGASLNDNFPSVVCGSVGRQGNMHDIREYFSMKFALQTFWKDYVFLYTVAFSWPNAFKGALWKKDERFDGKHCGSSRDSATKAKTWAEGSVVDFCN